VAIPICESTGAAIREGLAAAGAVREAICEMQFAEIVLLQEKVTCVGACVMEFAMKKATMP
jgi:hypothetical protein